MGKEGGGKQKLHGTYYMIRRRESKKIAELKLAGCHILDVKLTSLNSWCKFGYRKMLSDDYAKQTALYWKWW